VLSLSIYTFVTFRFLEITNLPQKETRKQHAAICLIVGLNK